MEADQTDVFYYAFYLYNYFCVYPFLCEKGYFGGGGFDGLRINDFQFVDWYDYASVPEATLSARARARA